MVAVALVVVLATSNAVFLLPALGCIVMLGAMMWMMTAGMGGHDGGSGRSDRS